MSRRRQLLFRTAVATLAALLLLLAAWRIGSDSMVTRADLDAPRSASGVLLGAEERNLGPENSRRAVLFVHGHVGAGQNFGDLPERLAADGWRVRVMRLPGHGTSPRDYERTTPELLVESVERELQALRARHEFVAIAGHSMGGALATIAASAPENDADALVLIAPYFGVTYEWWYGLPPEQWSRAGAPFTRWLYKGDFFVQVNKPGAMEQIVSYEWVPMRSVLNMQEIARDAADFTTISRIDCPVIWLHSVNDKAASYECAENVFLALPGDQNQRVTYTRSNHHLLFDYDGEDATQSIISFLTACSEADQASLLISGTD